MKIHSFESCGTVDGPGLRFVVFAQGCPLRCLYCHNPDTWDANDAAKQLTPMQIMEEIRKYKSFIQKGGVTVSGGEPLMQAKEVGELFQLCKKDGLHTALDTSGVFLNDDVKKTLEYTDLVLLDVKSIDAKQHKIITGGVHLERVIEFLDYLQSINKPTWIRHVVVPGHTDDDDLLKKLSGRLIRYTVVERVELLPYHTMATPKYTNMGIKYPLEGVPPLEKSRIDEIKAKFPKAR